MRYKNITLNSGHGTRAIYFQNTEQTEFFIEQSAYLNNRTRKILFPEHKTGQFYFQNPEQIDSAPHKSWSCFRST